MGDEVISGIFRGPWFFCWSTLVLVSFSNGLRLTHMTAPPMADVREEMNLDCYFDMEGEQLYSVKWYKDEQEFFRFTPQSIPNTMSFPVAGVHLNPKGIDCRMDHCKVRLQRLTKDHSGGAYRCEISSEAPTFRLASETHNISVAALPRKNPRIDGLTTIYSEGDTVMAKCTSDSADPAPILSWFINGKQAPTKTVGDMTSSDPDKFGLVSRSLTLRFIAEKKLSHGDSLELRCEAALPGMPLPPQTTTYTVPLRAAILPINNQKLLPWYSSAAVSMLDNNMRSFCVTTCMVMSFLAKLF